MTFIDFKKLLLDAEITVPKFANFIKVSEKNIPNAIAVIAKSFALLHSKDIDYRTMVKELELVKKEKKGAGFANDKEKTKTKDKKKSEKQ